MANWQQINELNDISADLPRFTEALNALAHRRFSAVRFAVGLMSTQIRVSLIRRIAWVVLNYNPLIK